MVKTYIKRNSIFIGLIVFVLCLFLFGCGNEVDNSTPPTADTYYTVSFYMDNGYTKIMDKSFKEGEKVFLDENPVKAETAEATFVFAGWSYTIGGEVEKDIYANKTMVLYAVFNPIPVGKRQVEIPVVNEDTFVYNGEVQHYELLESPYYTIAGAYQSEAGDYKVIVSLRNPDELVWEDGTTKNKVYDFKINVAENAWLNEPSLIDWKLENGSNTPSGKAKYGEVEFTYSDTREGSYTTIIPNAVGEYFMKAYVAGSDNYTSLTKIISFSITTDILPTYEVKFYDADLKTLDTQIITEGKSVEYAGVQLGKVGANIETKFIGWEADGTVYSAELPLVYGDTQYYAVYQTKLVDNKGTANNPYNFTSNEEFIYLSNIVNNGESLEGKYFTLENNIDLSNISFTPIGNEENPFKGNFDFRNHSVKYYTNSQNGGLFGNNNGTITNLQLYASVDSEGIAGGVAAINNGTITNVLVTGKVNGTDKVGGLVGVNNGEIKYSKSTVIVSLNGLYNATILVGSRGIGYLVGDGLGVTLTDMVWDGSVAQAFAGGNGSENNPYLIATAAQLAYLKDSTTSANSYYKGKYFKLTADIDLANIAWNGIGGGSGVTGFAGVFDGDGHVIYNVNINAGSNKTRAFFNSTTSSATISNLTLYGKAEATATYISLLSAINYANISNCNVFGQVKSTANHVGLLTSWNCKGNINDCITYGSLSGADTVGAITGYNERKDGVIGSLNNCVNYATVEATKLSNTSTSGVGGIVAVVGSEGTVSGCKNYGEVKTTSASNGGIGGIVGNLYSTTITECVNYGMINGLYAVGGIVGYGRANGNVINCVNNGRVRGSHDVGGISGENRSNISRCENNGLIEVRENGAGHWFGGIAGMSGSSATINNCTNNGVVKAIGSATGGVGGIVGGLYGALNNCENNGDIYGDAFLGGIAGSIQNANAMVTGSVNKGNVYTLVTEGTVNMGCIVGYNIGKISGNSNYGTFVLPQNHSCMKYDYIVGYDTVGETGVYGNTNYYVSE